MVYREWITEQDHPQWGTIDQATQTAILDHFSERELWDDTQFSRTFWRDIAIYGDRYKAMLRLETTYPTIDPMVNRYFESFSLSRKESSGSTETTGTVTTENTSERNTEYLNDEHTVEKFDGSVLDGHTENVTTSGTTGLGKSGSKETHEEGRPEDNYTGDPAGGSTERTTHTGTDSTEHKKTDTLELSTDWTMTRNGEIERHRTGAPDANTVEEDGTIQDDGNNDTTVNGSTNVSDSRMETTQYGKSETTKDATVEGEGPGAQASGGVTEKITRTYGKTTGTSHTGSVERTTSGSSGDKNVSANKAAPMSAVSLGRGQTGGTANVSTLAGSMLGNPDFAYASSYAEADTLHADNTTETTSYNGDSTDTSEGGTDTEERTTIMMGRTTSATGTDSVTHSGGTDTIEENTTQVNNHNLRTTGNTRKTGTDITETETYKAFSESTNGSKNQTDKVEGTDTDTHDTTDETTYNRKTETSIDKTTTETWNGYTEDGSTSGTSETTYDGHETTDNTNDTTKTLADSKVSGTENGTKNTTGSETTSGSDRGQTKNRFTGRENLTPQAALRSAVTFLQTQSAAIVWLYGILEHNFIRVFEI